MTETTTDLKIWAEAKMALEKEPLIAVTLDRIPERWRSMVSAALVVAYAHGACAGAMREQIGDDN